MDARLARFGLGVAVAILLAGTLSLKANSEDTEPAPEVPGPVVFPDAQYEPVAWKDLDGWASDDHEAAFATFLASCRAMVASAKSARDTRPVYPGLLEVCRRALAAVPLEGAAARWFFEDNFHPVRIARLGEQDGFLTGYYEPIVDGSRVPTGEFKTPIYRRPDDLIVPGQNRKLAGVLPNRGPVMRLIGRGKQGPYFSRAEIEDGVLAVRNLEICWVRDPADAFFIQIQGSARVRLEDGAVLRLNYAAHNGQPYTPIGRVLVERKIMTREEVSMDRIREWMIANPEEAKELRRQNRAFVFFRVADLSDQEEAVGGQGVPLMANRSIAVDKALHVYGTPFFIEADLPIASPASTTKFRRLMIAQDTGSAIVGPARADIYFGAGDLAGRIAGRVKHPGRFVMLIPREVDPVAAGAKFPLPPWRPGTEPPATEAEPQASPAPPAAVPLPRPRPAIAAVDPATRGARTWGGLPDTPLLDAPLQQGAASLWPEPDVAQRPAEVAKPQPERAPKPKPRRRAIKPMGGPLLLVEPQPKAPRKPIAPQLPAKPKS